MKCNKKKFKKKKIETFSVYDWILNISAFYCYSKARKTEIKLHDEYIETFVLKLYQTNYVYLVSLNIMQIVYGMH